jgi:hypothetical protein
MNETMIREVVNDVEFVRGLLALETPSCLSTNKW